MVDSHDALTPNGTAPIVRDLTYAQIIGWAAVIGIAGGIVATAYYYLLEGSMHLVWHQVPELLQAQFPGDLIASYLVKNYVWIAATIGGLLVGLSLYLMGALEKWPLW